MGGARETPVASSAAARIPYDLTTFAVSTDDGETYEVIAVELVLEEGVLRELGRRELTASIDDAGFGSVHRLRVRGPRALAFFEDGDRAETALEVVLQRPRGQVLHLGGRLGRGLVEGLSQPTAQDVVEQPERLG